MMDLLTLKQKLANDLRVANSALCEIDYDERHNAAIGGSFAVLLHIISQSGMEAALDYVNQVGYPGDIDIVAAFKRLGEINIVGYVRNGPTTRVTHFECADIDNSAGITSIDVLATDYSLRRTPMSFDATVFVGTFMKLPVADVEYLHTGYSDEDNQHGYSEAKRVLNVIKTNMLKQLCDALKSEPQSTDREIIAGHINDNDDKDDEDVFCKSFCKKLF